MFYTNKFEKDFTKNLINDIVLIKKADDRGVKRLFVKNISDTSKISEIKKITTREFLIKEYRSLILSYLILVVMSVFFLQSIAVTSYIVLVEVSGYYYFKKDKKTFSINIAKGIFKIINIFLVLISIATIFLIFTNPLFLANNSTLLTSFFVVIFTTIIRLYLYFLESKFKRVWVILDLEGSETPFYVWESKK